MKRGLIMEGGAMRGMFTAGVIDIMMEQGLNFDGAVGVSAGAVYRRGRCLAVIINHIRLAELSDIINVFVKINAMPVFKTG